MPINQNKILLDLSCGNIIFISVITEEENILNATPDNNIYSVFKLYLGKNNLYKDKHAINDPIIEKIGAENVMEGNIPIQIAPPKVAPPVTPIIKGSANGFRKIACRALPVIPKEAPISIDNIILDVLM